MIVAGIDTTSEGQEYVGAFVTFGSEGWVKDSINFCLHLKKLEGATPDFLNHMDTCIARIRELAVTMERSN